MDIPHPVGFFELGEQIRSTFQMTKEMGYDQHEVYREA